jgi:BlaI family transcriptional regulator, penicillinase repressor
MKPPKLAKLEFKILEVLWTLGTASLREIQQAFPGPRPAYTTITTTVYRMEGKGVVRRGRRIGNAYLFEPSIEKDTVRDSLLDEVLSFFGGRAQPMIAKLVEAGRLTSADIRELSKAVSDAERQQKSERMRKPK